MKLTAFLILLMMMGAVAKSHGQMVTLQLKGATIKKALVAITNQTGYSFVFEEKEINLSRPITVALNDVDLPQVLDVIFDKQNISYKIEGRSISLIPKKLIIRKDQKSGIDIRAKVINSLGEPLPGATIRIKGSNRSVLSGSDGVFTIENVEQNSLLTVYYMGYIPKEISVSDVLDTIVLEPSNSHLDAIQVIAYGTVSKRLNTGNVGSITAKDIQNQPIANPILALQGQIPGVLVESAGGLAGAKVTVQIRGVNSLANQSDPLYLVDGMPVFSGDLRRISQVSPLTSINPADIESIEVLKDADATAIYGSRGANGVIIITTKKGKPGKTTVDFNLYSGKSKATALPKMLNTQQYLEMRREAFANDGIEPTILNAPDLLVWDQERDVNWQELALGGYASTNDLQLSISGGNPNTQFRIGAGYHNETPLYSDKMGYQRGSLDLKLNHTRPDKKAGIALRFGSSLDNNTFSTYSFFGLNLPPNAPYPYDENGDLVWSENGVSFNNPFGLLNRTDNTKNNNLNSNVSFFVKPVKGLGIKVDGGYNYIDFKDVRTFPKSATDPSFNATNSSWFGSTEVSNWSLEPTFEYKVNFDIGQFTILGGASWQESVRDRSEIQANGYISDDFLGLVAGATSYRTMADYSKYRYQAIFGRINYNLKNKYLLNITARRDGSSRFGPNKQYGTFGAVGAGWIVSEEGWFDSLKEVVSFAKIRGSYGVTGNDGIGDYQYLDDWTNTSSTYDDDFGLRPSRLLNVDYAWERNKKGEIALEVGFFKDRILISSSLYRNISDNQLVSYKMPAQTGFGSILRNFPATILNSGWELMVNTQNINNENFVWQTSFNTSNSANKLIEFEGLETSSYFRNHEIGYPLNLSKLYEYRGIDPATGIYSFNGTTREFQTVYYSYRPTFFGGVKNSFAYKRFHADIFFHFMNHHQRVNNTPHGWVTVPGTMENQPITVLDRWQAPGDVSFVQKYTTLTTSDAGRAFSTFSGSDGKIVDVSFIRLKNVSISYQIENKFLKKNHINFVRVYAQGNNLAVFSRSKFGDPEMAGITDPIMSFYTAGFQINF